MISDAEFLERLVAGLCAATMGDAKVSWNQKIGMRQFDVVIENKSGPFNYRTLVEVKSSKYKIKVKEIEAFTLKSIDAGANKISVFSSNGFESGCIDVAKRHNVDLFTIRLCMDGPTQESINSRLAASSSILVTKKGSATNDPIRIEFGDKIKSNMLELITLVDVNGHRQHLSSEPTELTYILSHSNIDRKLFLSDLIESIYIPETEIGIKSKHIHNFSSPVEFLSNDELFAKDAWISSIEFDYTTDMAISYTGNVRIELSAFGSDVEIENIINGEKSRKFFHELALGFSEFEAGNYYFTLNPLIYYYCESIDGDVASGYTLESFHFGNFLHNKFRQNKK